MLFNAYNGKDMTTIQNKPALWFGAFLYVLAILGVPIYLVVVLAPLVSSPCPTIKASDVSKLSTVQYIDVPGRYYFWNFTVAMFEGQRFVAQRALTTDCTFSVKNSQGIPLDFTMDRSMSVKTSSMDKHTLLAQTVGFVDILQPDTVTLEITQIDGDHLFSFERSYLPEITSYLLPAGIVFTGLLLLGLPFLIMGAPKRE